MGPAKVIGLSKISLQAKCIFFWKKIKKKKTFSIRYRCRAGDAVVTGMSNLSWDPDFRVFSLGLVDDVDSIDEDVLQAAPEIWGRGQVGQILLYDASDI